MKLTGARILTEDFILEERGICIENGRIAHSGGGEELDLSGMTVIPGLIDIHLHGYMGYGIATASDSELRKMAKELLLAGTTSFLPTVGSRPDPILRASLPRLRSLIEESDSSRAEALGVYLEAPYVSPKATGAISPEILRPFDRTEFDEYNALTGGHIRIAALAPEIKENLDAIPYLCESGIVASIAHTTADSEATDRAIRAGASHATHLFNAMRGLAHREPGTVGAILDSDATAELISDGHHISPRVIRLAHRLLGRDRMILVSDLSTQGGLPDGEYISSDTGATTVIREGTARLTNGTLAGNVSPLLELVRRAVSFGVPFPDAVRAASYNPARLLGCADRKGAISEGKDADLLVLDQDLALRYVIKSGAILKI